MVDILTEVIVLFCLPDYIHGLPLYRMTDVTPLLCLQVGIHPSAAEEFVTMRTATRRVSPDGQVHKV